jgi:hypothetical protein
MKKKSRPSLQMNEILAFWETVLLQPPFKGFGLVLAVPADDDGVSDLARRARCRQTAQLLGADRYQFMPFKQRVNLRGQLAPPVITAADTQQAGTAQ